jgi:hypothetical protein
MQNHLISKYQEPSHIWVPVPGTRLYTVKAGKPISFPPYKVPPINTKQNTKNIISCFSLLKLFLKSFIPRETRKFFPDISHFIQSMELVYRDNPTAYVPICKSTLD